MEKNAAIIMQAGCDHAGTWHTLSGVLCFPETGVGGIFFFFQVRLSHNDVYVPFIDAVHSSNLL